MRAAGTYATASASVQLTMQNRGEYAALLLKHLLFTRVQVGGVADQTCAECGRAHHATH